MSENKVALIREFWCPLGKGTTLEDCSNLGCIELNRCIYFLLRKKQYFEILDSGGKLPRWMSLWSSKLRR